MKKIALALVLAASLVAPGLASADVAAGGGESAHLPMSTRRTCVGMTGSYVFTALMNDP